MYFIPLFNTGQSRYFLVLIHRKLITNFSYALFVTSNIEFSKPPILEFKRLQKAFKIKEQGLKHLLK